MDYKQELELGDPKAVKLLLDLFREIVRDEIKKLQFNRMLPAVVTNVGSGVASVQLLSSGDVIPDLPNKTGEALNISDEVYVELINSSTSNMYIALKKV